MGDGEKAVGQQPDVVERDAARRGRDLTTDDMERMNAPRRYWRVTADGIQDGQHKVILERYMGQLPDMMSGGYGLLLWGKNGTGKTGAAVVLAKEARRHGFSVLFVRSSDFRDHVFGREMFDHKTSWADRARKVQLLILDDLGKEGGDKGGHSERVIEDLIRARVAETRVTVLTTNFPPKDLVDPEKGGYRTSFVAAMKGAILPVEFAGKDLRSNLAAELVAKLGVAVKLGVSDEQ